MSSEGTEKIEELDIFRDELRLWQKPSLLIPPSVLDSISASSSSSSSLVGPQPPSPWPSYVPPMILDVILDTSGLDPDKHVLMIEEPNGDDGPPAKVKAFPQDSSSTAASRSIVLESWRLDFALYGPPSPPELPTLYKRSIIHFRQLQTLLLSLPSQGLFRRLQKTRQESLAQRGTPQEASEGGGRRSEWDEDEANALKLGVRMAIGQPAADDVGICGLREPLGSAAERLAQGDRKAAMDVTETFAFSPMINALGSLNFSVEYRSNADIFVEELEKPPTSNLTEIEMDEDYFRPAKDRFTSARQQAQGGGSGAGVQQQQQASVFTPSAAGRPVAGLSGLRRSPSVSAGVYGTSPGSAAIGPTPPSPALAAALSSTSEAARCLSRNCTFFICSLSIETDRRKDCDSCRCQGIRLLAQVRLVQSLVAFTASAAIIRRLVLSSFLQPFDSRGWSCTRTGGHPSSTALGQL
ncbi:hypothetical protein FA10DRAFT_259620 [Acaromyces ingoldii]|uniref:Autophagy-related protein 13 n=1 Tax=Acaromyces ingoldii TaxID=215250 RepID=A0A316YT85_9BASI|nr:hypothetical protein FA10DRAFT_259620 [Acaromyces ingoldii]PWN92441.1 hypothetical protein FA10DRAFT_259620 [Acaromyces ingoldii]